jgi:hypothetical protein
MYLQWDGEAGEEPVDWTDVSWCADQIYDGDIEYVRADLAATLTNHERIELYDLRAAVECAATPANPEDVQKAARILEDLDEHDAARAVRLMLACGVADRAANMSADGDAVPVAEIVRRELPTPTGEPHRLVAAFLLEAGNELPAGTQLFAATPASGTSADAQAELQNFVEAKRFDRDTFLTDTEFADWMLSRARHTLARLAAPGLPTAQGDSES